MPIKPRNATNTIVLLGINFHCLKGFLLLLQYRILSFYEADRLGIKLLLGFHKFIGTQKINQQKGSFGKRVQALHISGTHIAILPNRKENTEGPRLTRILGLEKKHATQNLRYLDFRGFPFNVKIPHLCVLKPKTVVVESMAVKTA